MEVTLADKIKELREKSEIAHRANIMNSEAYRNEIYYYYLPKLIAALEIMDEALDKIRRIEGCVQSESTSIKYYHKTEQGMHAELAQAKVNALFASADRNGGVNEDLFI